MFLSGPLHARSLAPQPPLAPEIEGHLKKLKRKTSNLTGSWNKRWFFVDPKRLEFGYSATKAPNMPKSSIYLNDITAVLQFDDTHFQVESRTRNFFLCGESKASTTCWVRSLDEYCKKLREYEKEMARVSVANSASVVSGSESHPSNQAKVGKKPIQKKRAPPSRENPARDSLQDSSSSVSVSSSSNLTEEKLGRHAAVDEVAAPDEHRTPSPSASSNRHERRETKPQGTAEPTPDRSRERERGHGTRGAECDHERLGRDSAQDKHGGRDADRSTSSQRRGKSKPMGASSHSNATRTSNRPSSGSANPGYAAHPTHGYVMHAWMDEYER